MAEECYEVLRLWYLFEEHDYFSTRMHTREHAGDALLRTMLVKSIRTVATLIDVNFHVITKAWFPLVIRIVIIRDSYDFPTLGFLRLLRFLGQPGSQSSQKSLTSGMSGTVPSK